MTPKELKQLIKDTVLQTVSAVLASRQFARPLNYYKMTEARLYAYPILKHNVEIVYPADIADLKKEKTTGHSTSIVIFSPGGGGEKLSPEEAQERRIMLVELKMQTDRAEIMEIDNALNYIQREGYAGCLKKFYIEGQSLEDIAREEDLAAVEMGRIKARLVKQMSIRLYGALALEK
jgi:hypothetical protein